MLKTANSKFRYMAAAHIFYQNRLKESFENELNRLEEQVDAFFLSFLAVSLFTRIYNSILIFIYWLIFKYATAPQN